jgi:cytochrome b6-f complex iron-sulfur subunit
MIMANSLQETPMTVSRRKFIQVLLGFSIVSTLAGIIVPIIAYLTPAKSQMGYGGPTEVGKVEEFPQGSGIVVSVSNKPVIVVNTKTAGIRAFSAICTHLGCIVNWDQKRNLVASPCHDGLFNPVTGAVVSGPPPRPLPSYELAIKDGKVLIGKPLDKFMDRDCFASLLAGILTLVSFSMRNNFELR